MESCLQKDHGNGLRLEGSLERGHHPLAPGQFRTLDSISIPSAAMNWCVVKLGSKKMFLSNQILMDGESEFPFCHLPLHI